jgi:periplasmic divalent cation tolerance protein
VVVVLSTFAEEADAARVGRELVERRLAACVNVVPGVRSIYRWQGRIEDSSEVLAIVKTQRACLGELIAALAALHPYAVPEILALPVAGGAEPYAKWVREETSPG